MKYFNKRKNARQHWATIHANPKHPSQQLKLWCQRHASPARFYFVNTKWWFENPEDAVVFKLQWG